MNTSLILKPSFSWISYTFLLFTIHVFFILFETMVIAHTWITRSTFSSLELTQANKVIFPCIWEVPSLIYGLDIEAVAIQCSVPSSLLNTSKNQMLFSTLTEWHITWVSASSAGLTHTSLTPFFCEELFSLCSLRSALEKNIQYILIVKFSE